MTQAENTAFGRESIASMQETAAIVCGEKDAARIHLTPGDIDVRAIRERLGLTRPLSHSGSGWQSPPCAIGSRGCVGPIRPRVCF